MRVHAEYCKTIAKLLLTAAQLLQSWLPCASTNLCCYPHCGHFSEPCPARIELDAMLLGSCYVMSWRIPLPGVDPQQWVWTHVPGCCDIRGVLTAVPKRILWRMLVTNNSCMYADSVQPRTVNMRGCAPTRSFTSSNSSLRTFCSTPILTT